MLVKGGDGALMKKLHPKDGMLHCSACCQRVGRADITADAKAAVGTLVQFYFGVSLRYPRQVCRFPVLTLYVKCGYFCDILLMLLCVG